MAIITISRGSHSMGTAVAEKVAERLGYRCVSREVLLEASDRFDVPEIKLARAIGDAPSILERLRHGKQGYVAYFQSALTHQLAAGDVVYHGLAGHVLLKNVPHVIKVRILADIDLRISVVMDRETISRGEAATWIAKVDRERRKWTRSLYGVDPTDPSLYDLLLNIPRFQVDDAVELICQAAKMGQFQPTAESEHCMTDLVLACQIKAALVPNHPDVSVASNYGNVVVYAQAHERQARKVQASVQEVCSGLDVVNSFEVHAGVHPPPSAV